jgi:hypothetical protein
VADQHWIIRVDAAHIVRVDSWSLTELDEIGEPAGLAWYQVSSRPLQSGRVAQELYDRACRRVGVEPRPLSAQDALTVFDVVPDDGLANEFVDGLPDPLPEATPSTSG